MPESTLDQQLSFLLEIDRLKSVIRKSPLIDKSRRENTAEHSWHLAMYALVLAEHANDPIDVSRVIKMLLIHDVVEIDAGDTPIHEASGREDQAERERAAAERIFGLLPETQAADLRALWAEFELAETADAQFAKSLDRFQPLLHNIATGGGTWTESNVSGHQVTDRYGPTIRGGSAALWRHAQNAVSEHFIKLDDRQ